ASMPSTPNVLRRPRHARHRPRSIHMAGRPRRRGPSTTTNWKSRPFCGDKRTEFGSIGGASGAGPGRADPAGPAEIKLCLTNAYALSARVGEAVTERKK